MKKVNFSEEAISTIQEHAKAFYPNECCGFMFGSDDDKRTIKLAIKTNNSREGDQRKNFEISAVDYMKAEQYALQHKIQLLGIYHSHPDHPAIPSEHDLRQAVPFFSYVIVSVMAGEIAKTTSWQLGKNEIFVEENILIPELNSKLTTQNSKH